MDEKNFDINTRKYIVNQIHAIITDRTNGDTSENIEKQTITELLFE